MPQQRLQQLLQVAMLRRRGLWMSRYWQRLWDWISSTTTVSPTKLQIWAMLAGWSDISLMTSKPGSIVPQKRSSMLATTPPQTFGHWHAWSSSWSQEITSLTPRLLRSIRETRTTWHSSLSSLGRCRRGSSPGVAGLQHTSTAGVNCVTSSPCVTGALEMYCSKNTTCMLWRRATWPPFFCPCWHLSLRTGHQQRSLSNILGSRGSLLQRSQNT
mmetsp:Transcript_4302/g.7537  ORF Transcript_4302/g.7537 Transcript_4302/m.7537 type:complete len:214 (-) Transcript_4302:252-893(-)